MYTTQSHVTLKIFSTAFFLCIALAIILITRNPSRGYELSIYSAISPITWALLVTAIAGGVYITVHQAAAQAKESTHWWQIGTLIIVLSNLVILLLSYLRGYAFNAIDDHLTHLGQVKTILLSGHLATVNVYPPTHILIAQVSTILKITPEIIINFAGPFFFLLFVMFTFFLSREIMPKSAAILATVASTVLCCYYYIQIFPMGFSFATFPLIFYLYFKHQKKNHPGFVLLLMALIVFTVLFHMVASFMLTLALLIMELSKPLANWLYFNRRENDNAHVRSKSRIIYNFFLVSLIALFLWVWNYYGIWQSTVINVARWFHAELLAPAMTQQASAAFGELHLNLLAQFELFFKMYGVFFIYGVFSMIAIIVILRKRASSSIINVKSVFMFSCFFLVSAIMCLIDLVQPLTGLGAGRILWLVASLFPPLVGLASYTIGGMATNKNANMFEGALSKPYKISHGRIMVVFLTIFTCSIIGVISIYPSPFILQPNMQATYMDTDGEYWLLKQGNPDIRTLGVGYITTSRFAAALFGIEGKKFPKWDNFAPAHFNYNKFQYFGESLGKNEYLTISKAGKLTYLDLYPQIDKFTNGDFTRLGEDPTVDKLYCNSEMEVYYIRG